MFQDFSPDPVSFDSTWDKEKETKQSETQTEKIEVTDSETSCISFKSTKTQTSKITNSKPQVNEEHLAAWLKKIYPFVEKELTESNLYDDSSETSDVVSAKLLNHFIKGTSYSKNNFEFISDMKWNSTGNTFVASYSKDHESWCQHDAIIKMYTTDRNGEYSEKNFRTLVTTSCVTTLAYHNTLPSILAAGTYDGELIIYDTAANDNSEPIITKNAHSDYISQLTWRTNVENQDVLISSSVDGFVILWIVLLQTNKIDIKEKYKIIPPEYFTRTIPVDYSLGVKCFSFSPFENEYFVLGCEGGNILRCSTFGARIVDANENYKNPVVSKYVGHVGGVKHVEFSYYHKDLFVSCGIDGSIHIYNFTEENVLQQIHCDDNLNCVYWIPNASHLLFGCATNGSIKIYSLINNQAKILTTIEGPDKYPLTVSALNNKK